MYSSYSILVFITFQFERDWFEEREAAFHWMRGKQGARMANELEKLGLSSEDNQMPPHKPLSSTGKRFPEMTKSSLLDKKDGKCCGFVAFLTAH